MKKNLNHSFLHIKKASGEIVPFDVSKFKRSLLRSGVSNEKAEQILEKVQELFYPGITTKKIYQIAYKLLQQQARPLAARYKLKSAIMELGPSGFPFENYVAAILQEQGYKTQTGIIVNGKCVKHEIDVIVEKETHHFMIECKYHNRAGHVCDVKIPLYIHARFRDVEAGWMQLPGHEAKLHQGWVVTNTKFTTDAIQYGTCAGLKLVGWDYPQGGSLNEQIEKLGLYPLTCLTTLSKTEKTRLLEQQIVLCKEINDHPNVLKKAGIDPSKHEAILQESKQLCEKLLNHAKH